MGPNKATIIVTGGAGFIGSNVARTLLEKGFAVLAIDNFKSGKASNIPPGCNAEDLDIRNSDSVEHIIKASKPDAVLHFAAQSSGEVSHYEPRYDLETNALGSLYLLQACLKYGVKRFIAASSMSTYGDLSCPDGRVEESRNQLPKSYYGISKLAMESYCRLFSKSGMAVTVFRMFSVYGPGQDLANDKQGMLSIFFERVLNGKPILVKGGKDRVRDFIYIDDVVRAWVDAINLKATFGQTYNLGTGKLTTVEALIRAICDAFGTSPDQVGVKFEANTPGDVGGFAADMRKFEQDFRWLPDTELNEGIARFKQSIEQASSAIEAM